MPAIERSFAEAPPADLYLDSDLLIAYLVVSDPHHQRAELFLERLAQSRTTTVYLSTLSWIELVHVIVRERIRQSLPKEIQRRLRLDRWHEPLVRQAYVQAFASGLSALLAQFSWVEIDLNPQIRAAAIQLVAQYSLGGQDAVHVASATWAGVLEFASFDRSFRRIDGLSLWNDQIHSASL